MIYSQIIPQYGTESGGGGWEGVPAWAGGGWEGVPVWVASGPVVGWLHHGVRTSDVIEYFGDPWAMPR